jgi:uncharacterized membrane protein YsdA (DUF1294 family)
VFIPEKKLMIIALFRGVYMPESAPYTTQNFRKRAKKNNFKKIIFMFWLFNFLRKNELI